MKKLLLNHLELDVNKLSNDEKRQITGGYVRDCMVRCKCPGQPERWVPRGQCNIGPIAMCLESLEPDCEPDPIVIW